MSRPAMIRSTLTPSLLLFFAFLLLQGCSPNLGPLYRDYEVDTLDESAVGANAGVEDIYDRILAALDTAGWDTVAASAPNVIKTDSRILNRWLLYRTVASLEVIPIGDEYVRVLIHPYRHNFLRMKSKLPYLPKNVERQIVPELSAALEAQGLYTLGNIPADSTTVE